LYGDEVNRLATALLLSVLAAACSAGPGASPTPAGPASYADWPPNKTFALIPYVVTQELVVGQVRLLVNLIDAATNESAAAADHPVQLRLYYLAADATNPALTTDAAFMTVIPQLPGLYRATVNLDRAGQWGLEAIQDPGTASERTGRLIFDVRQTGTSPAIGAAAPSNDTPTATDAAGIAEISTDDDPDPDFYTTSIAGALAAHESFVVVFSTPAFLRTATSGPTLDVIQSVAAAYEDRLTFIHVEPYELTMTDGHLQPVLDDYNNPIPVQAVDDWGLPTEPYVFVVDADGKVSAKFEGLASADELTAAFSAVAS
jgi:hypothetical protein